MELVDLKERWPEVLSYMKETYEISNVAKKTWLDPLKPVDMKDGSIYLLVSDAEILPYLRKHYESRLQETIRELFQETYTVSFLAG